MPEKPQHRSKLMANTDRMTMFVSNVTSAVRSARMKGAASSESNVTTSTIGITRKRSSLLPPAFRVCALALVLGTPIIPTRSTLPRIHHLCFVDHVVASLAAFAFADRDIHVHLRMIMPGHHSGSTARAFLEDRMIERGSDLLAAELPAGRLDRFLIEFHTAIHAGRCAAGCEQVLRIRKFLCVSLLQCFAEWVIDCLEIIQAANQPFHFIRRMVVQQILIVVDAAKHATILLESRL